jgi:hypothetical protein
MSSITKQQYIYLFNTLRHKNIINAESDWDDSDRRQDMMRDWSNVLNTLNYKGQRNNFEILKQYVDNLPSPIPPPNFISDEESISPPFISPPISPPIIESNQQVNQNFIPNENMAQPQGIYGLNVDPAMDALIKLVGQQRKEIRKMEKLMTPQRAQEFVQAQNYRLDPKTNQMVQKKNPKFDMLNVQDYDGDGLPDTVVTKEGKVYSFNGFLPKDTDYPLRRAFLMQHSKHTNRFGHQQYDRYSVAKTKSKTLNPNAPRERKYNLNFNFDQQTAGLYPAIQKYQMKSQPTIDNATTVISNEILRPVWYSARRVHQSNPQIIDATDGINYFTFKNTMMDEIFTTPLSLQYNGFSNLKPKKKTEIMNHYFDTVLAAQHDQLIQRAITQVVLLKSQQSLLGNDVSQQLFAIIYEPLRP